MHDELILHFSQLREFVNLRSWTPRSGKFIHELANFFYSTFVKSKLPCIL